MTDVGVTPAPVLLNGNAWVTAIVDDSDTGGSDIASAQYRIDNGTLFPMAASDGDFNDMTEIVKATFTATDVGVHTVCVRGTDTANNTGGEECQTYLVTYNFEGFYSPVENGVRNVAKAGQAIPVKWRLTDANNVPIENPSSFVALQSFQNDCESTTPVDAVDEVAAGNSGLQYLGDGYWQFNWKTEKAYANTCRGMYVKFDSTATTPVVQFQFKK